jgi:hypothetical protein
MTKYIGVLLATLVIAGNASADEHFLNVLADRCQAQALNFIDRGDYILPDTHEVFFGEGTAVKIEGEARPTRLNRSGFAVEYECDFVETPEGLYAQTAFRKQRVFDRKWKQDRPADACPEGKVCGPLFQRVVTELASR